MEVKPGYKQTEVGVIPEDWVEISIGQLITAGIIHKPLDGNHGNIHPKSGDFVDYGIPFIMANNVQNGKVDLVNCSFIRKAQADSLQKGFSKSGDILLTHKATIGNTAIVGDLPFDYIMLTPQVTYYRVTDSTKLNNHYLRQFFDSTGFQSVLRALAGGGTRSYIGIKAQHQLPVVLPPRVLEQRAIAEALGDVDALLGALDRLIAKKRDLKQAAMQQLLTGQTRLPEFQGKWEWKTIDQVGLVTSGKRLPLGCSLVDHPTPHPYVRVTDMRPGTVSLSEIKYVPESVFPAIKYYRIYCEDIFISVAGSLGIVGKVPRELDGANLTENADRITKLTCSQNFLLHVLMSPLIQNTIDSIQTIGAQPKLALTRIRKFTIPHPSLPEQTAIAEVLSDMDAELAELERRRDKTRMIKQGMMQELLTGRTRLL